MIVVVTGSRSWTDKERIRDALLKFDPDLVVHGDHKYKTDPYKSADALTQQVCEEEGIPVEKRPADWEKWGRKFAGPIRNREMLEEFNPDWVLAFWDGKSTGTQNCIQQAYVMGIPCEVHLNEHWGRI